jgi:hypothetical protein
MIYLDYGIGDFQLICWCGYNALNESRELHVILYNYCQYLKINLDS